MTLTAAAGAAHWGNARHRWEAVLYPTGWATAMDASALSHPLPASSARICHQQYIASTLVLGSCGCSTAPVLLQHRQLAAE